MPTILIEIIFKALEALASNPAAEGEALKILESVATDNSLASLDNLIGYLTKIGKNVTYDQPQPTGGA